MRIVQFIQKIADTASSTEKMKVFKEALKMWPQLTEIFNAAYSPKITYGVKEVPLYFANKAPCWRLENPTNWEEVSFLLNRMAARDLSGNKALQEIDNIVGHFNEEDAELIRNIIQRELHCGFTGGYKKNEFQVVLAQLFEEKKHAHKLDENWFISRKLDGVRCIAKVGTKDVEFFSRTGKPFGTLSVLKPILLAQFPAGTVLDGEMCIIDDEGNEDFTAIVSEIKRKNHTIAKPHYKVFDMMTEAQFSGMEETDKYSVRLAYLRGMDRKLNRDRQFVSMLDQYEYNENTFTNLKDSAAAQGWEGLMLRKDEIYKAGRIPGLLKVKAFQDAEYKVEDVCIGSMDVKSAKMGTRKLDNLLLSVTIMHKGNKVEVGSGFNLEERIKYGAEPFDIMFKTITVKYFQESQDSTGKKSLRFPTLKCLHGEKRGV